MLVHDFGASESLPCNGSNLSGFLLMCFQGHVMSMHEFGAS